MEAVRCCAFRGVVPMLYLFSPAHSRTCPDFLIPSSFTSSRAPCRSLSSNCPYRKLDLGKKGEVKEPRSANHSVCRP